VANLHIVYVDLIKELEDEAYHRGADFFSNHDIDRLLKVVEFLVRENAPAPDEKGGN